MRNTRSSILATALAVAAISGMGVAQGAMPAPRKGSNRDYKPPKPERRALAVSAGAEDERTKQRREIAEWNRRVEEEKTAKKLAKQKRRSLGA